MFDSHTKKADQKEYSDKARGAYFDNFLEKNPRVINRLTEQNGQQKDRKRMR